MAKKKRKRTREPESPIVRWVRRNPKWPRRLGATAGLIAIIAAIWFIADPFGGTPTAIDESGQEVRAGVIEGREGARARVGSPAPNFLLPDYDQRAVRLDQFEGKAVFVNFWASWCTFCEDEMPDIVRIAEEFPDDVVVIAINRGESQGTAQGWTRSLRFPEDLPNFKWVVDSQESVWRKYRQGNGMPQTVIINASGIISREIRRVSDYDEMLASIQQALPANIPSTSGS